MLPLGMDLKLDHMMNNPEHKIQIQASLQTACMLDSYNRIQSFYYRLDAIV